jgi:hypothetical protein
VEVLRAFGAQPGVGLRWFGGGGGEAGQVAELLRAFDTVRATHEAMDPDEFNDDGTYQGCMNQVHACMGRMDVIQEEARVRHTVGTRFPVSIYCSIQEGRGLGRVFI